MSVILGWMKNKIRLFRENSNQYTPEGVELQKQFKEYIDFFISKNKKYDMNDLRLVLMDTITFEVTLIYLQEQLKGENK